MLEKIAWLVETIRAWVLNHRIPRLIVFNALAYGTFVYSRFTKPQPQPLPLPANDNQTNNDEHEANASDTDTDEHNRTGGVRT